MTFIEMNTTVDFPDNFGLDEVFYIPANGFLGYPKPGGEHLNSATTPLGPQFVQYFAFSMIPVNRCVHVADPVRFAVFAHQCMVEEIVAHRYGDKPNKATINFVLVLLNM